MLDDVIECGCVMWFVIGGWNIMECVIDELVMVGLDGGVLI